MVKVRLQYKTWVRSLGQKALLQKKRQPTLVFLPGDFHGQRSLMGFMRLHRVRALCEANSGHSRSAGGDRQHLEKVCVQCALVMMGECCDCQI